MCIRDRLESQGLKEGIHYEKQVTLRDRAGKAILNEESGKRMIPCLLYTSLSRRFMPDGNRDRRGQSARSLYNGRE